MTTNNPLFIQSQVDDILREAAEYRAEGTRDMNGRPIGIQALTMDREARDILTADEADRVLEVIRDTQAGLDNQDPHAIGSCDPMCADLRCAAAQLRDGANHRGTLGYNALCGATPPVLRLVFTDAEVTCSECVSEKAIVMSAAAAPSSVHPMETEEGIPSYTDGMTLGDWYDHTGVMLTAHRQAH